MYFISQLAIHFMFYKKQGIGSFFRWYLHSQFAKHTIFVSLCQREKFLIFRAEKFLREIQILVSVICECCVVKGENRVFWLVGKYCGFSGELRIFFGNRQI
jgi:hypothetical protein